MDGKAIKPWHRRSNWMVSRHKSVDRFAETEQIMGLKANKILSSSMTVAGMGISSMPEAKFEGAKSNREESKRTRLNLCHAP